MKKLFVTAAMAASLVFGSSTVTFAADSFSDVPSGHWAYKSVNVLVEDGIINPEIYFQDKNFSGNSKINRYDVAIMLGNLFERNYNVAVKNQNSFSDVTQNDPAYKAVELLNQYSIMEGYGNGTFRGTKEINRFELAAVLARFLDKIGVNASSQAPNFSDVPENHWAYNSIAKVSGLMEGYGDGTFRGNNVMNRFELALIIAKIDKEYLNK